MEDLFYDERSELAITVRDRPHWKQYDKIHFVTWRQADSLAQAKLKELAIERAQWLRIHGDKDVRALDPPVRREYYRLFHERVEHWLDAGAGSCVLRREDPRMEVVEALRFFDGERYRLGTFAVAANHVHVLVVPIEGSDLSRITHTWKSYTAKSINRLLGRAGTLWRAESFDHIVRSEGSLRKFEEYICEHDRQGAYVEMRELVG
jgi:hypothetical protein